MRRLDVRRRFVLSACLALALWPAARGLAQDAAPLGAAIKFDEFGQLRGCDFGARLDNFAIQLQQDEGVIGYVVSYGPEGKGPGTGNYNLLVIGDYLVNSRGIDKERFRTVYAGRYKNPDELATELWMLPNGAQPPEPKKYRSKPKSFTGKFDEYVASDFWIEEADSGTGPSAGDASLAALADTFRRDTKMLAYIVTRSSRRATPRAWRRVARSLAESLEKNYEIAADRIRIIFAGYDKKLEDDDGEGGSVKVQLWILPEDAPPPAKEAKAERRPREAMLVGSLNQYQLIDSGNAERLFEGFADVLSADQQMRACIIYRPSVEPPDPETGPDEPPRADLQQVVEKWKADLAKKHSIDEARLVIISAAATRAADDGTIETWVVPPGAALPDAYPPEEEEEYVEEAEAESPQGF